MGLNFIIRPYYRQCTEFLTIDIQWRQYDIDIMPRDYRVYTCMPKVTIDLWPLEMVKNYLHDLLQNQEERDQRLKSAE